MTTAVASNSRAVAWGPYVELAGIPDVFGPQLVEPFTAPEPGIDNLGIKSRDGLVVVDRGEFEIDFTGYVRVARSRPTDTDWVRAEVYTNLIEMYMRGEAPGLGPVIVSLDPDCLSAGQLKTPFEDMQCERPEKACRMAVSAVFTIPHLNVQLVNREPIELTIDNVRAIPPAGNPGVGRIYRMLPLYRRDENGLPAAYLTSLTFAMGTYLTEQEVEQLRADALSLLENAGGRT